MYLEHRLSAPLRLHLRYQFNTRLQYNGQRQLQDETRNTYVWGLGASYIRKLTVLLFLPYHYWEECWLVIYHCNVDRKSVLTHWGRDKMAAIFQTMFSNGFSWIKMHEFRLTFHWSLFLGSNQQYANIGSGNGLAPTRRKAIIGINDGLITDAFMRYSVWMS